MVADKSLAPDPPQEGDEFIPTQSLAGQIAMAAGISSGEDGSGDEEDFNVSDDLNISSQGYMLFLSNYSGNMASTNNIYEANDDDDDDDNGDSDDDIEGNSNSEECNFNSQQVNASVDSLNDPTASSGPSSLLNNNTSQDKTVIASTSLSLNSCNSNRLDITVDCDKVRAAMNGFTLPPSAIPPWAVGVSDQDITNHINKLLSRSRPNDNND